MKFDALGTSWEIESDREFDSHLVTQIHEYLESVDMTWSRFRDDSTVAAMSKSPGSYDLPPQDIKLLEWYKQLYDSTDGKVTPLIGQTLSDAGYDTAYSLRQNDVIATTPTWDQIMTLNTSSLSIHVPALLDVGAAGKGFAIDGIAAILDAAGASSYVIDGSGDILIRGKQQTIGLEHPHDASKVVGIATVADQSICGSAVNRRSWGDWHHIIDPISSRPTRDIVATWAIADTAMIADGIATALFFTDPDTLQQIATFDYVVVYADGAMRYTNNRKIEMFL